MAFVQEGKNNSGIAVFGKRDYHRVHDQVDKKSMSVILELVACVVLVERADVLNDATVELVQGDVSFGRNGMLFKADVNADIFVGSHGEETSPNWYGRWKWKKRSPKVEERRRVPKAEESKEKAVVWATEPVERLANTLGRR